MKRILLILVGLMYITSVSGVTINHHYCGGKLATISLSLASDHSCRCGSKKMKKDCCKNQQVQVKVKCEHKSAGKFRVNTDLFKILPACVTEYTLKTLSCELNTITVYRRPPPRPNNSLLVLNSVFRI
jgi:hypothetical protein